MFLAGFLWICVGTMLVHLAYSWLTAQPQTMRWIFLGIGFVAALLIHHLGFLRIANQNLERIMVMDAKQCLFAFISWKSYMIIIIMVTLGILLRHSHIPKPYLSILYAAIGLALILSSIRYLRVYVRELKKHRKQASMQQHSGLEEK
jgi:hypothetical protein